jgi:hypothetical protein
MKNLIIIFVLFSFKYGFVSGQEVIGYPLVPFNTNFSYWDHHWIMWTPQHPTYEAIEVMVQDNNEEPGDELIRIFFTERSGLKKQVHYFNDAETVKTWRGEAYFRTMNYKVKGEAGHPLDLFVKFMDKDSSWVEWSVKFDKNAVLGTQGSGLKDQGGHASETVFLVFYNGLNSTTPDAKLSINGKDFSSQTPIKKDEKKKYYVSAYSAGVYTPVISYAQSNYIFIPEGIKNSWGRVFRKTGDLKSGILYKSNSFGFKNNSSIEIETNLAGEITTYTHLYAGHSFRIQFNPALPVIHSASTGQSIRYNVALDNFSKLVEGVLKVEKTGDNIHFHWEHQNPAWTKGYWFQTNIQTNFTGYSLSSSPIRK